MMENSKMRILLLDLLVLAMFCSPGGALRCFQCEPSSLSCTRNVTCKAEEDACLQFVAAGKYYHSCWKYADCNIEKIAQAYQVTNVMGQYMCCQRDLCNAAGVGSPITKTSVVAGLLVVVVGSFYF
ncbi:CD59 glycoprotein [Notamacropus eugenii]|uniref:CD59 glycoprotein n=1 Tax=Notamacropus eugenii TaxID=9315 RepID=UPI003B67FA01